MSVDAALASPSASPGDRRGRWLRRAASLAAVLGVVALYVWDDVVLAAPIAAAASWLGAGYAFVMCAPIFFLGSSLLALAAVRAYEASSQGRASRLERWLEHQTTGRRGRLADRVLRTTGVASFVLSSVLLGGTVTTWLIRYSGRREGITGVALVSSAINAVTFVGLYTGIFGLLF